jgi:hypothetical protein
MDMLGTKLKFQFCPHKTKIIYLKIVKSALNNSENLKVTVERQEGKYHKRMSKHRDKEENSYGCIWRRCRS